MAVSMEVILEKALKAVEETGKQLDSRVIDNCVEILNRTKGNILVTGMGTSGTVARRAAHLLGCAGMKAFFVHPADQQHGSSGAISKDDLIIVFSKGGESEEINSYLNIARRQNCTIIAVTGRKESTMVDIVDETIVVEISDEYEGYGLLPTASTLSSCVISDIILLLLLDRRGFDKEGFGVLHPGGMTGKKLGAR